MPTAARARSARPRPDWPASLATAVLAVTLVGGQLAVDPGADAAFDAPKRLITLVGIALATALLFPLSPLTMGFGRPRAEDPRRSSPGSGRSRALTEPASVQGARHAVRLALALLLVGAGGAVVSAALSPRRALALDSVRVALVYGLLLAIGASRVLAHRRGQQVVLAAFLAAATVNAAVAALQSADLFHPVTVQAIAGRTAATALVGNEALLALTLGLAAIAALWIVLVARLPRIRLSAGAMLILLVAVIGWSRNVTVVVALGAGVATLLVCLLGRRALLPLVGLIAVTTAAFAVQMLARTSPPEGRVSTLNRWDALSSYRIGPWAAAIRMGAERPLVGWGPGTFASEFVSQRVAAEAGLQARLANPFLAGAYAETHSEYLQAVAEVGVPTTLALVGAVLALTVALIGAHRRSDGPRHSETALLLAVLALGAVSALTWFPLQRAVTAVPLLLALGRAWTLARA